MVHLKKIISAVCVLTLIVGMLAVCAVSASAAELDKGETIVDVKKGDEVSYTLTLGSVDNPIIGCDFSFYYDSSVFEVTSVADFTNKTDSKEWQATLNPDLDGQVRGNWAILKGVDFSSDRNFLTVNLKALKDGSSHLTYFVRYMYDDTIFDSDDKPQITKYLFTCSINVNGKSVAENEAPEVDTEKEQKGLFVNSVTGDSKDADPDIPGTAAVNPGKKTAVSGKAAQDSSAVDNGSNNAAGGNAGNSGGNSAGGNSGGNSGGGNSAGGNAGGSASSSAASGSGDKAAEADNANDNAPLGTTPEGYFITATDSEGNIIATSDTAPTSGSASKGGLSPIIWVIIALVVLAGGGLAVFFILKKGPSNKPGAPGSVPFSDIPPQQMNNASNTPIDNDKAVTEAPDDATTEVADDATTEVIDTDK